MSPFLLMTALYVALALLGAMNASLASYSILPWFNGLRWVRVHLITLGAMTEAIFGLLPVLVAARFSLPRPEFRWDIWLTLNAGLVTLLVGIPIINQPLIFTGGTLIFTSTALLILHLRQMRPPDQPPVAAGAIPHDGRKFYIAGLAYLTLGIIVGTGLWLGWSGWLQIKTPIEVHIHANNWGFLSLVFAGLFVDFYPRWTNRRLAWSRSITPIFWMMTAGAFGLVLGPWVKSNWFSVPGLVLHLAATIWLLLNVVTPLLGDRKAWSQPGIWHLVTSYGWILAPVLIAPLILLGVPGFPGAGIEQNAPQALIYGWAFQFGYAVLPYFFYRAFLPAEQPRLGGSWLSLVAIHLGGAFLWASIFITPIQGFLHGTAYALWALSIMPIAIEIKGIVRVGLARLAERESPASSPETRTMN